MSLNRFFYYFGSKAQVGRHYPRPRHDTIIEPFAGGAGYSLWHHNRRVILVEKNPVVVGMWRYLIRTSESEIMRLPLIQAGQTLDELDCCQEARWLIGHWLAATGATGTARKLSGHALDNPEWWWSRTVRARIATQVGKIRHWQVIEGDYSQAPDIEATWFVDPPYQTAGVGTYTCDADQLDFDALADWCRARRGQTIVCENEGATWLPFTFFRSLKSMSNGVSREAIWTNESAA